MTLIPAPGFNVPFRPACASMPRGPSSNHYYKYVLCCVLAAHGGIAISCAVDQPMERVEAFTEVRGPRQHRPGPPSCMGIPRVLPYSSVLDDGGTTVRVPHAAAARLRRAAQGAKRVLEDRCGQRSWDAARRGVHHGTGRRPELPGDRPPNHRGRHGTAGGAELFSGRCRIPMKPRWKVSAMRRGRGVGYIEARCEDTPMVACAVTSP